MNIAIREGRGDELGGALVFLPDADFDGELELLVGAALLESRRDKDWLTDARDYEGEEPFAQAPVDSGEVVERSAGTEDERVDLWIELPHEFLRVGKACLDLFGSDRVDAIAEGLESGKLWREL